MNYGLDQLVINYPQIGDCIGDNAGSPIPWAIENLLICSNEVLEISIDSSSERTIFKWDDQATKFRTQNVNIIGCHSIVS